MEQETNYKLKASSISLCWKPGKWTDNFSLASMLEATLDNILKTQSKVAGNFNNLICSQFHNKESYSDLQTAIPCFTQQTLPCMISFPSPLITSLTLISPVSIFCITVLKFIILTSKRKQTNKKKYKMLNKGEKKEPKNTRKEKLVTEHTL